MDRSDRTVKRTTSAELSAWLNEPDPAFSLFVFDVRQPDEFAAGHLPEAVNVPGGQLVQTADEHIGVRGARLVLLDDDGVRAALTASWMIQLGWRDVFILAADWAGGRAAAGWPDVSPASQRADRNAPWRPRSGAHQPGADSGLEWLNPLEAFQLLEAGEAAALDFSSSQAYRRGHVKGAAWTTRADIRAPGQPPARPPSWLQASKLVVVSEDGRLAAWAARDLTAQGFPAAALAGGLDGPRPARGPDAGLFAAEPADDWRMPYLDPDASKEEQEAYFQWEHGLTAQLKREKTVSFRRCP
ncbi:MAG: hypothetical protein LBU12_07555 [Deltaproteobacteria bacterium]|nr:hypothetical protein [Deltaproteobacteria bacterium]